MNQNSYQVNTIQLIGLMLLAYAFSFAIRLIWVFQFHNEPSFIWNNELMINTNDGYFFAAGAQQALEGLHIGNPRVFGMWDYGTIAITTFLVKITGFSLETVTLYMPAVISSLVVVPIILIARLYKKTLWGFFAALLGSITWSYYNRTMVGYYDTDMFSAMAPMLILFFLMKSTMDVNLKSTLYASIAIVLYPFLYDQGLAIVAAMSLLYFIYMIVYHKNEENTYKSIILVALSAFPISWVALSPYSYLVHIAVLIGIYFVLNATKIKEQMLYVLSLVMVLAFLYFSNMIGLIFGKVLLYLSSGTKEEGLHFYSVIQTVREAGDIPFSTFAQRISGSVVGMIIALIGYVVLVVRHRAFILALPLIGIGMFALWGGLRFTVYAVPVAAMSAIYLFFVIAEQIQENKAKYLFITMATALMIYPNITHIIEYKVPTVLNKAEVEDLDKLNQMADVKDYTLAWWDYGYPIWYYSDTSTLIDGGKHNNDNFIISKIMQTPSPELAVNFARLAVETYVDSNYAVVANTLFKDKNPNVLLSELSDANYTLPKKSRDIYLYLPYRMMDIFPTVAVFGNINLNTGKEERNMEFYPSSPASQQGSKVLLRNGIIFDSATGDIEIRGQHISVYRFDSVQYQPNGKSLVESQLSHIDGEFCVVYLQSYNQMIVMDRKTYNSTYVQMFMLDNYDKNLFELVVSSPYSKIYKLKK
jgi:dolichyl-diphosphooligosaccharide--protein glycosyltransferase/undecaprenyl-diphosphooligosaccharide--protein glycosyltransferase